MNDTSDEAEEPSEAEEEAWCESQRQYVIDYLEREQLKHGRVGEWPAWHVYPYVAIWAIESLARPEWIGWWAISGDLPTDFIPCGQDPTPRAAAREFGLRWKKAAVAMAQGRESEEFTIGRPDDAATLAPLLASRASILLGWAEDDEAWDDDPDDQSGT
ncbi:MULTISPECIES: DUF4826 family protein [unclassified Mesorhizobium]|uniref:DUF4826 family protein n=1 Tax=unclassified Mesorhizobium TaxID=325217 RepID=UPI0015E2AAB8|nr:MULTISPECIES: DUF4826 family protein [unclassified Mesorhizobium]MBZ9997111.1 DUF4826 family protein [Mesorhizobium sp. BH1-1-4]